MLRMLAIHQHPIAVIVVRVGLVAGGTAIKRNDGTITKTVEQTYDMFNRWTKREIDPDGALGSASAVTDKFLWDGTQLLIDIRSDGATVSFAHGPGTDMVLFEDVDDGSGGGALHTLLGDHLNTVRDVLSTAGTVENHLVYSSFGLTVSQTGASTHAPLHRFTGRPFEITTGLGYNLNRWYDPETGKWTSEDPIGFDGGLMNLASYVGNNAVAFADATGLNRYMVTNGFHWWIVVEQWSFDPNTGRQFVVGYTALDYSAFGFTARPADSASAVNQWWSTNGPGAYGAWVVYKYSSSPKQDSALLTKWMEMSNYTPNLGYALGYALNINCISMSDYWASYGGRWGSASGPVWYR